MSYYSFRGLPSVHLRGARDLQLKSVQIYVDIRISVIVLGNILPWFCDSRGLFISFFDKYEK